MSNALNNIENAIIISFTRRLNSFSESLIHRACRKQQKLPKVSAIQRLREVSRYIVIRRRTTVFSVRIIYYARYVRAVLYHNNTYENRR